MRPQNIDEVDQHLLEQHGTDTIREVIMHDDWPDFGHQARGDGRTIVRYPDDEEIYFLLQPEELATLFILRAGALERRENETATLPEREG